VDGQQNRSGPRTCPLQITAPARYPFTTAPTSPAQLVYTTPVWYLSGTTPVLHRCQLCYASAGLSSTPCVAGNRGMGPLACCDQPSSWTPLLASGHRHHLHPLRHGCGRCVGLVLTPHWCGVMPVAERARIQLMPAPGRFDGHARPSHLRTPATAHHDSSHDFKGRSGGRPPMSERFSKLPVAHHHVNLVPVWYHTNTTPVSRGVGLVPLHRPQPTPLSGTAGTGLGGGL
jgi:hypothetical protein